MNQETGLASTRSLPRKVGPYRLENRLGIGGMGEVYRAWDERLERWVAVKRILAREKEDLRARERLRREARTIAGLNHPAIVHIHDIIDCDGADWIVMELVEGRTLHHMLQDGPLQVSQALYLALEIIDGLAEAHSKGIIHRDLKTENVMVTPSGHARILDFGLAKRLWPSEKDASLSVQGTILGTGRAMSPEQVLGEAVDHRSDLFSFGTLLYEMTTGERPFVGSSLVLTLAQVCSEEHQSARDVNRDMPEELSTLIDRLLEKAMDRRPQSAREVAAILAEIAGIPLPERGLGPASESVRRAAEPTPTQIAPVAAGRRSPARGSGVSGPEVSISGIFIKTLLLIHLLDLDRMRQDLGESGAYDLLSRHDRMVRDMLSEFAGLEIDKKADGFLLLFERPLDAVRFAVAYQQDLGNLGETSGDSESKLAARIGIHLGEVMVRENTSQDVGRGAKPVEIEGPAREVVGRLVTSARSGQILVTQEAARIARRSLEGSKGSGGDGDGVGERLEWFDHGLYAFGDEGEEMEVFEVALTEQSLHQGPRETTEVHRITDGPHPGFGRQRRSRWSVAAVLVLVVGALAALWFSRPAPSPAPTPSQRQTVAVLGFKNLGQPDDSWMATALGELIFGELQLGADLQLVASQNVARIKIDLNLEEPDTLGVETLETIRRQLGSQYLVLGSFIAFPEPGDQRIRLHVFLQDTVQAETVATWSYDGFASSLDEVAGRSVADLREALGLTPSGDLRVAGGFPSDQQASELYFRGLEALRTFDAQEARKAFEASIVIEPDFALSHASLGQAWQALGYDTKAAESAERAYELAASGDPSLARDVILQIEGRYHEANGKWAEAVNAYQGLWGFYPDNIEYGLLLASAQTAAGKGRDALQTIQALAGLSDDPRIDLAEVDAHLSLSDAEQALDVVGRAIEKDLTRGASVLLAEARLREGRALFALGRHGEAKDAYAMAEALFRASSDLGRAARVMNRRAHLLMDEGDAQEAEKLYREAMEHHREIGSRKWLSDVENGLAFLLQARGELDEAAELLTETIDLVREVGDQYRESDYLDTLTWVLLQQGRWDEAKRRAEENLELCNRIGIRNNAAWAYYYLGRVTFAQGDLNKTRGHYGQALSISEAINEAGLAGYALRGLAEVLLYGGNVEEAEILLQDERVTGFVFGEQVEPTAWLIQARLAMVNGSYAEAVDLADRAMHAFQDAERLDEALGAGAILLRALLRQDRIADARRIHEKILPRAELTANPVIGFTFGLAEARLWVSEGKELEAQTQLRDLRKSAEELPSMALALEIRLAKGELQLRQSQDRATLEGLTLDANAAGFGLIAYQAQGLIQGHLSSASDGTVQVPGLGAMAGGFTVGGLAADDRR